MCLWSSLAHFADVDKHEIRARVCTQFLRNLGAEIWNGKTYADWIKAETGLSWRAYVAKSQHGEIWAGVIELHQWSKLEDVGIEVYVQEKHEYKRIMNLGRPSNHIITLDYQNGCHHEPLVKVTKTLKASTAREDVHEQNIDSEDTVADDVEEYQDLTIFLGKLSSWSIHHNEALQMLVDYDIDIAVITETRIHDNSKAATFEAAAAGYNSLLSDPRPLKQNIGGPKEGGVAILINGGNAAPDLGRTAKHMVLDADFAIHTAIPLPGAKNKLLHIIGAYISVNNKQQILHTLEYAASLGDVPIIIAADWNNEVDQCQELVQARLTGNWFEIVDHLASNGNEQAKILEGKSSTHRSQTNGQRVDYMLVNKQLKSMIGDVVML